MPPSRVWIFYAFYSDKLFLRVHTANYESRTIAPTDNRSYAKFDRADSRSYDVLTGRTVAPTMFWRGGQSLLHYFDNPDSGSHIILTARNIISEVTLV